MISQLLEFFILRHLIKSVLSVSMELEEVLMILPESLSVRNRDKCNSDALHVLVEVTLDVNTYC